MPTGIVVLDEGTDLDFFTAGVGENVVSRAGVEDTYIQVSAKDQIVVPITGGITVLDELSCEIYGLIKEGQPILAPNLVEAYHPTRKKIALFSLRQASPGTSALVYGMYLNAVNVWVGYPFCVEDYTVRNPVEMGLPPGYMALDVAIGETNISDPWNPTYTRRNQMSSGDGIHFIIESVSACTVRSNNSPAGDQQIGTNGFFTGKTFDRVVLGHQGWDGYDYIGNLEFRTFKVVV